MNAQLASSILIMGSEFIALLRDLLTRHRQEQATAVKPATDALKAQLDAMLAEAWARESARQAALPAANAAAGVPSPQDHAEALRREIEHLVREALLHSPPVDAAGTAAVPPSIPLSAPQAAPAGAAAPTADQAG